MVELHHKPLDVRRAIDHVSDKSVGGIDVFIGTVRDSTRGKKVVALEFEAYEKMALKEMEKIASEAQKKWPVENIIIHHRYGTLAVGDAAVIIAVSTPHRKESFEACQFIINTLKESAPIWKKEIFSDGEEWVSAHP